MIVFMIQDVIFYLSSIDDLTVEPPSVRSTAAVSNSMRSGVRLLTAKGGDL